MIPLALLEHAPKLNQTIEGFNQILSEKGKVIIAVPNHKNWGANYYIEFWAAWDVPIHLWNIQKILLNNYSINITSN